MESSDSYLLPHQEQWVIGGRTHPPRSPPPPAWVILFARASDFPYENDGVEVLQTWVEFLSATALVLR